MFVGENYVFNVLRGHLKPVLRTEEQVPKRENDGKLASDDHGDFDNQARFACRTGRIRHLNSGIDNVY